MQGTGTFTTLVARDTECLASMMDQCSSDRPSLCPMQIITPFNIYFNARLIFQKWELWRLITNFLYFGNIGQSALRACVLLVQH